MVNYQFVWHFVKGINHETKRLRSVAGSLCICFLTSNDQLFYQLYQKVVTHCIASTSTSNDCFFVSIILVTYCIHCPHPNQRITCCIHISIKLLSPIVSKDITVTWNSTFVALPAEKKQMIRKFEKCLFLNWEKKENVQRKYYFYVILCPGDFWEIRLRWCLNLQSSTAV